MLLYHNDFVANNNRYEGSWKNDKKHGSGKYFYLDKGKLFEGVWVEDIPKCGEMVDFARDEAPDVTEFPIPEVRYFYLLRLDNHANLT